MSREVNYRGFVCIHLSDNEWRAIDHEGDVVITSRFDEVVDTIDALFVCAECGNEMEMVAEYCNECLKGDALKAFPLQWDPVGKCYSTDLHTIEHRNGAWRVIPIGDREGGAVFSHEDLHECITGIWEVETER